MTAPGPISRRDRLFDATLALPPEERAAYLEGACPDDPELRVEILALVNADEAAVLFFEELAREWVSPLRSTGVGDAVGASPRLRSGSLVGRYEIVEILGEGGMGVVYRAWDPDLEREVALKVLPPHTVGNAAARAELMAEARRIARLDHPHIGVIHEVSETADAGVYLVMACHDGETLADRLRRGPLPLPSSEVLRIGRGVAAALEAAHGAGIIHRDVKPSNVLLTEGGGVRLVDFGIAAAVGEAVPPRGSRGYMGPEVVSEGRADPRTDLWSLGILLHEMVTGVRPPPPTEGLPALDAVEAGGGVSAGVATAIRRCLNPDPLQRPARAAEVLALLERELGPPTTGGSGREVHRGESLPGAPSAPTAHPRAPRRTRIGALTGGLAGALALALVSFLIPRGSSTQEGELGPLGAPDWSEAQRVLVLPLEDRTGDPALAMVGSMAADWIAEGIAGASIANVVEGGAALTAFRDAQSPVEAARAYRAGLVVTGSYYLDRDSIRLATRLVDGASGTLVRALDPIAAPREDPLAGIEPLRQAILSALALHLDPLTTRHELLVTQRPPPWDAFVAYARGKDHFIEYRMAEAREEMSRAEAIDPEFYLAIFYGAIAAANLGDREDLLARRDRLAPFADRLNRPTRLGLDFLNSILMGDLEASYRIHRRGVDDGILAPGTMGHAELILAAATLGRFDEALEVARDVDPMRGEVRRWFNYWLAVAGAQEALGDFSGALETALRAREALGPLRAEPLSLEVRARAALGDFSGIDAVVAEALRAHPQPALFLMSVGDALVLSGHGREGMTWYREAVARARADRARDPNPDQDWILAETLLALAAGARSGGTASEAEIEAAALEAQTLFRGLHELNPDFFNPPTGLGRVAAVLGDPAEARRWADHLAARDPEGRTGHLHFRRARIAALLGDVDAMMEALDLAFRSGYRSQLAVRSDPAMMHHRAHPAVAAFLRPR
jgi:tetratricopeptide (TPR) repeat protein